MRISKQIMWIISKSHREKKNFFDVFAIHSSSRHEKHCQMLQTFFGYFNTLETQGVTFTYLQIVDEIGFIICTEILLSIL